MKGTHMTTLTYTAPLSAPSEREGVEAYLRLKADADLTDRGLTRAGEDVWEDVEEPAEYPGGERGVRLTVTAQPHQANDSSSASAQSSEQQ